MNFLKEHLQGSLPCEPQNLLFWHRLRWNFIEQFINFKNSLKILDIGAGTGIYGYLIKTNHSLVDYFFMEPIEELNELLIMRHDEDHSFFQDDDRFKEIDVILLLDVLEHIENDKQYISEIINKAKKGCKFIITVPALSCLWSEWDVALGHVRRYTTNSLKETIQHESISFKEINYIFPEMVPFALYRKYSNHFFKTKSDNKVHITPTLPRFINFILYLIGKGTFFFRKILPFGTSVFIVFEKR